VIKLFSAEYFNIIITFGLFVLIWIIQILHYPSFNYYSKEDFSQGMISHQFGISIITIPLMLTELLVTCLLFYKAPDAYSFVSFFLVICIWLSTFFIQVPLHKKLLAGKETALIKKLILTNWIRTFLWTFKLLLIIFSTPIHSLGFALEAKIFMRHVF
jgi:hypothetical protein